MAAEGTRLGTGFVEISPDFSRFQELLGKRLSKALGSAKIGDRLGRDLADELGARLSRSTRRSKGDMFGLADAIGRVERESRKAGRATKGLERDIFGVNRAAKDAGRKLRSARSELNDWQAGSRASSSASRNLSGRLRALGNEFRATARNARAGSGGFGAFNGGIARVNRSFSFFRNILRTLKWPLLIASVGLAAQGLSALAAGAVAASSAIGPLAGSLIALPAAALAAAQAISTLKLATAGVSDAIKASLDVQVQGGEQAVDTMRRQEDATERVADAKRNLISVERQAKFAQEDLTEARRDATRELEDMREAADRSHESEEQASLSLRQARAELNRTLNDVDASGLDIRIAEADVDRARADLTRTRTDAKRARQDYRDAQKTGVEGMPQVVAAKRAEADAIQAVKDAQRDYGRAVRDSTAAMEEQGSAATALQQKMAQLPAAARDFVREIVGLKPKLDALRATAASGFFPGATKGLRALLQNFGPVKAIVGETAEALGGLAERAGKQLGSAEWGKDLRKLGKGNTRLLERMGEAAGNLADALRHIMVAAQPFLDWLGESTVNLTEWIEGEAEAGRESGRLAEFFDRVRESMELMGPILKGVGGALLNIGEAARPLGNEILKALGGSAEGWREWSDSIAGKNDLKQYFTEAKPAIFEMGKLIGAAGKAFFELGKQRGVAELLRLVRTELIPALTDLFGATTGFAADFLKQFGRLRREGMPTFEAFLVTLADKAGEAGGKMIRALWKAFWGASIWGKAAIGALLLSKFDGLRGVLWGLGTRMGKRLGMAIIGRLAPTIAAEMAAGSKLGEILSARMYKLGKIGGRRFMLGVLVAIATLAPWLGTKIGQTIPEATRVAIKRWGYNAGENFVNALIWAINKGIKAINDKLDAVNVLGKLGVDAPEIGEIGEVNFHSELERQGQEARKAFEEGFIEGPGGKLIKPDEIPAPKTDRAREGYRKFNRDVRQGGVKLNRDFREQLDKLPGVAERNMRGVNTQSLPRLDTLSRQAGQKGEEFANSLGGSFRSVAKASGTAMGNTMENLNRALKALGVKVVGYTVKGLPNTQGFVKGAPKGARNQRGGEIPAFATGGLASVVPGNITGDRHVLSLNGQPVARVESKEGIFVGNRKMMGALAAQNDRFPRFGMPKLAQGGIVSLGKQLQREGYEVGEHPAFGGVDPVHSPNSYHYRDQALDINDDSPPFASGTGEPSSLDRLYSRLQKMPGVVELLWRVADHYDHLHVALGKGATGALGFVGGGFSLPELKIAGPDGPLRDLGQKAVDKVRKAAMEFAQRSAAITGSEPGVRLHGSGNVEKIFAEVAKRLSTSKVATLALGEAGFAESGMRDLGYGDSTSEGALQLLSSTASSLGIDPHDEAAIASTFLTRGFYHKGANQSAREGLSAHMAAQEAQGSAFSDGSNYLAQEGAAKQWMRRFGLKRGGLLDLPGLIGGGATASASKGKKGPRKYAPMQRSFERLKSLGLGGAGIAAFDSRRGMLSSLSEQAEQFSEWASNASALTFEDQAGNSIQGVFQGGTEGSWLLKQLSSLGELRNQLIVAREEFTALRERVEEMVARAKRQIEEIKRQIKRAQSKRSRLTQELRQARQNLSEARDIKDPKRRENRIEMAQQTIASLGERITQLDFRQNQRAALQSWIKDKTLPALGQRLEGVKAALTGTMDGGEGFIGLKQVHGIAGPMDQITGLSADTPPIGTLGGEILNVQARLRAIREEGKARAGSGDGDSEREGLLEELLRQANQRTAVSEAQKVALEGWDAMRQGFTDRLPRFHSGGRIEAIRPGPGEVPLMAKVGESVLDEEDTRRVEEMAANGGNATGVVIESIVIHEDGRATVRFEGREFEAAVERVAKRNRPMGIATAGGARR